VATDPAEMPKGGEAKPRKVTERTFRFEGY
jgi:hypothetical protein